MESRWHRTFQGHDSVKRERKQQESSDVTRSQNEWEKERERKNLEMLDGGRRARERERGKERLCRRKGLVLSFLSQAAMVKEQATPEKEGTRQSERGGRERLRWKEKKRESGAERSERFLCEPLAPSISLRLHWTYLCALLRTIVSSGLLGPPIRSVRLGLQ